LITSKQKLNTIRLERLKAHGLNDEANYASFERIDYELKYADQIMKDIGCMVLNVADKAIEETASTILQILKEVNNSEKIRLQF
jgi:regulator of PEP synthase PpsR (kinase-PPPase family)